MKKYGVVRKIAREPHEIEGFYRVRMNLMQIRGVSEGAPVKVRAAFGSVVNRFEFETGTSRRRESFEILVLIHTIYRLAQGRSVEGKIRKFRCGESEIHVQGE